MSEHISTPQAEKPRRTEKPYKPALMPEWMRRKQEHRIIGQSWQHTLREPFPVRLRTALKLLFGKP